MGDTITRGEQHDDRGKRLGRTAAVVALTAAIAVPVTAYAADTFNDVPDSNIFHDDIDWMAENGVTKGCNPPDNDEYCPEETLTRQQMAAFMHRLETEGVFLPADGTTSIASGSSPDSQIASEGEVARMTVEAPTSGDVIARLTGNWANSTTTYLPVMWIEPHDPGNECDDQGDGDPIDGTFATTTSDSRAVSMAGAGADQGVSAGSHEYSLCYLNTGGGTPINLNWSGSVEWRAGAVSSSS